MAKQQIAISAQGSVPAYASLFLDGLAPWLPGSLGFYYNVPAGKTLWVTDIYLDSKRIRNPGQGSRNSGAVILIGDGLGHQLGGLPTIGDQMPFLSFKTPLPIASGRSLYQGHFDNQGPEVMNMILIISGFLDDAGIQPW